MMGLWCLFLGGQALVRALVVFVVHLRVAALAVSVVHPHTAALVALEADRRAASPILVSDNPARLPATLRRYSSHEDDFGIERGTLAVLPSSSQIGRDPLYSDVP